MAAQARCPTPLGEALVIPSPSTGPTTRTRQLVPATFSGAERARAHGQVYAFAAPRSARAYGKVPRQDFKANLQKGPRWVAVLAGNYEVWRFCL